MRAAVDITHVKFTDVYIFMPGNSLLAFTIVTGTLNSSIEEILELIFCWWKSWWSVLEFFSVDKFLGLPFWLLLLGWSLIKASWSRGSAESISLWLILDEIGLAEGVAEDVLAEHVFWFAGYLVVVKLILRFDWKFSVYKVDRSIKLTNCWIKDLSISWKIYLIGQNPTDLKRVYWSI